MKEVSNKWWLETSACCLATSRIQHFLQTVDGCWCLRILPESKTLPVLVTAGQAAAGRVHSWTSSSWMCPQLDRQQCSVVDWSSSARALVLYPLSWRTKSCSFSSSSSVLTQARLLGSDEPGPSVSRSSCRVSFHFIVVFWWEVSWRCDLVQRQRTAFRLSPVRLNSEGHISSSDYFLYICSYNLCSHGHCVRDARHNGSFGHSSGSLCVLKQTQVPFLIPPTPRHFLPPNMDQRHGPSQNRLFCPPHWMAHFSFTTNKLFAIPAVCLCCSVRTRWSIVLQTNGR